LSKETPPSPPLAHNWREFLYMDGSHVKGPDCVGPGIGAAVHIPGEDTIAVHCAWEGEGADAKCNTICRAELAALNVALTNYGETHKRADNTLHVATDSLASMYGLAKMITRPQDLREHRHRTILESLAQAVRDHTGTIHLWKVKSHTGIIGNELADQTAVLMAKGEIPEEKYHLYTTPSNNRENMHWPYTTTEREFNGVLRPVTTPLPDMKDALKQQAHTHTKYGSASQDGTYAKAWFAIADTIHHSASHAFTTSTKVNARTRKLTHQYRWGLLPTQRYLLKIKKSDHGKCPLCGEDDGGHHVLSGCSALTQAHTRRHNDAGTEILEAISRGTKGGHILLSDVGFTKCRSSEELPEGMQPHRYMRHMDYPDQMSKSLVEALGKQTSVPDITLVELNPAGSWYFTFVELKYCRDTDPEPQRERAAKQHKELLETVKAHDKQACAKLVTLTLGVSGVIYEDFMQDMQTFLGVEGPALKSLARRLHFIAVNNLRQIWAQRTAIVRGLGDHRRNRRTQENRRSKSKRQNRTNKPPSQRRKAIKRAHPGAGAPEHRKKRRKR
jgi:ribonuclease HI